MKRLLVLSVSAIALFALGLRVTRAQAAPQHPDTQKLVMENTLVRVFEIRVPAGVAEPRHTHARGLTIALSDYDNETKSYPDGRVNRGHSTFGQVRWAEPVDHEAKNVGTTEQHVIRIEIK